MAVSFQLDEKVSHVEQFSLTNKTVTYLFHQLNQKRHVF